MAKKRYKRLTQMDRCMIDVWVKEGRTYTAIAAFLEVNVSTVSREIRRNRSLQTGLYCAFEADKKAKRRFKRCRKQHRITPEIEQYILDKFRCGWSPDQMAGRLRKQGYQISYQTIYRYTHRHPETRLYLKRVYSRRFKMRPKGPVKPRRSRALPSVHDRPEVANRRGRIGDWERDTMYIKDRTPLLVMVDRKTRYTKIALLKDRTGNAMHEKTMELLRDLPFHTMTNDRGSEFQGHFINDQPVYYCDPMRPSQRGTVENTIGLIRRFLKNSTALTKDTEEEIKKVEDLMNSIPRKCLKYFNSEERFKRNYLALVS